MTVECLVGWNVVWQSGYNAKKDVTMVADGCRGDVFVPDELVPFDLQHFLLI